MDRIPPEIIVSILKELPFYAILRAREVCSMWLNVIQSSVVLEYQVELQVHRKVDGPHSTLSIADRLKALRNHAIAWRDLAWTRHDLFDWVNVIPRLETPALNFAGDHLRTAWFMYEYRISLHGFPSTLARHSPGTQVHEGVVVRTATVFMDVERNSLVYHPGSGRHERDSDIPGDCVVTQTLVNINLGHSINRFHVLYRLGSQTSDVTLDDIRDDLLLLTITGDESIIIIIVQWTTGRTISEIKVSRYEVWQSGFALLPNNHFLVTESAVYGARGDLAGRSWIGVFKFQDLGVGQVTTPVRTAVYLLPGKRVRAQTHKIWCLTSPPSPVATRRSKKPFADSEDDWILSFRYSTAMIVTHASNLLRHTSDGSNAKRVPWEEWGLERARCFPSHQSSTRANRVYGERLVMGLSPGVPQLSGHHRYDGIGVYDFNQRRVRRARHSSAAPTAWPAPFQTGRAIHSLEDSTPFGGTVALRAFPDEPIVGRLPYLVTVMPGELEDVRSFDIDEEHVIAFVDPDPFERSATSLDTKLEVFTM